MRKDRILDLANIIENDELENVVFDMSKFAVPAPDVHPVCGTAACIAGYAFCAAYGNVKAKENRAHVGRAARKILGLSRQQAHELFVPCGYRQKTKSQAVKVLRHLAETGKVDWSIAS